MELSDEIKSKLMLLKEQKEKVNNLEREVLSYFEAQGIDTSDMKFADAIGARISYGEYDTVEDLQESITDYLK